MKLKVRQIPYLHLHPDGTFKTFNTENIRRYIVRKRKGNIIININREIPTRIYNKKYIGVREIEVLNPIEEGDIIEWDNIKKRWYKVKWR